jgi:hypothetical protein
LSSLSAVVLGWSNVIGQTLQGQYFLDYLTEMFFPLYLGVSVYPIQSSWLFAQFGGQAFLIIFILTLFSGGFVLYSIKQWIQGTVKFESIVVVLAAIFIYAIVWAIYTFQRQYGYAVFKMASWLQFMLVPFVAYGLSLIWSKRHLVFAGFKGKLMLLSGAVFLATNFISTIEYGYKGLGHDQARGYIVNNFDMSGNRDYLELQEAVRKYVEHGQSIGVSVVDSIQNFWIGYYLKDTPISLLSHENIPGDDENLPGILSNQVTDYYGNIREANNVFFHGAIDAYYLIWNESHLNKDIAIPRFRTSPVWQNRSFRLFKAADNPDMIFTGRGFYRMEYNVSQSLFKASFSKESLVKFSFGPEHKPYWWPERKRWTAEGGELYLLRPSAPGKPYTVTFDAIVGFEYETDSRTVELYANGVKFDEFEIISASRYISRPFVPKDEVTKIVIKVREKVGNIKRNVAVWNKDIPIDYRKLNLLLSNIRVSTQAEAPLNPLTSENCELALVGNMILECALWFNGVQVDRWVGKHAHLGLRSHTNNSPRLLKLNGYFPGNLNFNFPAKIDVLINGVKTNYVISDPGDFTLFIPIIRKSSGEVIDVLVTPDQHLDLKYEHHLRRKIVTQSFRLNSLEIE